MSLSIAAVVVAHDADEFLARTLENLASQDYPLQQVVVVDTAGSESTMQLAAQHGFSAIQPGNLKLGEAINAGLVAMAQQPNWVWILHEDSAPEPAALRQLAKAAEISPSVAVIGPKLLNWKQPIQIQQMGLTATRDGKPFLLIADEYDQGQHDASSDTLAVSTAGMLVSVGLWQKLGGLDDSSPVFAQDLEFGLRARAAGFRVIVEASARVHHAGLSMAGQRARSWTGGNRRLALSKAHLHLATTLLPLPLAVLLYLALPLLVLVQLPLNLLAKNPGRSLGQLFGWLWAWSTVLKRFAARGRTRSFGSLASIQALFATSKQVAQRRKRRLVTEIEPKNPVKGLFASGSILLAAIPLALSFLRFPGGAISSENLDPLGRSFGSVVSSVGSATAEYLGGIALPSEPFGWIYALFALVSPASPSLALASFVFAAPALIFIGVWLLLGAISSRPWVRSALALLVALSPQVIELAQAAAVVELAVMVSVPWTLYFLNQSVTAFNSARAWRWMSLAGFGGAVVAVASPLVFTLLILATIGLSVQRISRLGIASLFAIPGIALLIPWIAQTGFSPLALVTSSARISYETPTELGWAALGLAGVLLVAGFGWGRLSVLIPLTLAGSAIGVTLQFSVAASFAELPALLALIGSISGGYLLNSIAARPVTWLAGSLGMAAVASGVFGGIVQERNFQFVSDRLLPALVVAQADVDPDTRTLLITLGDQVSADLIWGEGRAQEDQNLLQTSNPQSDSLSPLLAQLTGSLLAGNADGVQELIEATSTDFVLLSGDPAQVSGARVAIDSLALMQQSGETESGILFRVLEPGDQEVVKDFSGRNLQLGVLAVFVLLAIPTPATLRGYRRVRGEG